MWGTNTNTIKAIEHLNIRSEMEWNGVDEVIKWMMSELLRMSERSEWIVNNEWRMKELCK